MTDRDANERLLRLNAALDGELDAMGSLEFEREMRDDPALAAEYRRLTALRDAVRRHAPREAAPQALADRIAALTASAPAAPPPQAAVGPERDGRAVSAPRMARQSRAGDGRLLRGPRALRSARGLHRCARLRAPAMSPNIWSRILPARRLPASRSTSPPPTGIRSSPGSPTAQPSAEPSSISRRRVFRWSAGA